MINHYNNEDFDKIINQDKVLVDFFAEWCGPCKMMGKVLEDSKLDVPVWKINTDLNPELAQEYGVMSIPTLLLFSKGKVVKKNIGFMSKEELNSFINE